jgi:hypothetical protein
MNRSRVWLVLGVVGCLSVPLAYADDATTDDSVTVAGASDTPDQVATTLPDAASDTAREHAAFGQNVASQARDRGDMTGREFGQQVSTDARDLGAQMREDMQTNQHATAGAANAGSHGRP